MVPDKMQNTMANNVDPDEMNNDEPSHQIYFDCKDLGFGLQGWKG